MDTPVFNAFLTDNYEKTWRWINCNYDIVLHTGDAKDIKCSVGLVHKSFRGWGCPRRECRYFVGKSVANYPKVF